MHFFSRTLFLFVILTISTLAGFAQGSTARTTTEMGHISNGGNFAIMLPADVTAQRQITPGAGTRGGMQYFWRTGEGEFFVSFYDNTEKPSDAKEEIEAMSKNFLSGITKNGGKALEKKSINLDKYPGLQIKAALKTGETTLIRYYSVNKRVFVVSTRWNTDEVGEKQAKVLDSFRLLTK